MGDVDGNGVTDLLASDINLLSVRLGNGDGTFTSLPSLGFPAFHLRSLSLTLGRLDADSTLDLVTGSEFTQCAGVHFGRGDGTFQFELGYGSNGLPIDVALGDLDENGVPDIVVANRASTTVTVLLDTSPKTVAVRPPVVGPQRLAFSRVWPRPASGGLLHASFTLPARGARAARASGSLRPPPGAIRPRDPRARPARGRGGGSARHPTGDLLAAAPARGRERRDVGRDRPMRPGRARRAAARARRPPSCEGGRREKHYRS